METVLVNGKKVVLEKQYNLSEFLVEQGYEIKIVAVLKNGDIVPRNFFDTATLLNTDKLEIVSLVGGGC